jgi:hypothetical protein
MAFTANSSHPFILPSSGGIKFFLNCHYQKGKPDYQFDNLEIHPLANYRALRAESVLANLGTFSAKFHC